MTENPNGGSPKDREPLAPQGEGGVEPTGHTGESVDSTGESVDSTGEFPASAEESGAAERSADQAAGTGDGIAAPVAENPTLNLGQSAETSKPTEPQHQPFYGQQAGPAAGSASGHHAQQDQTTGYGSYGTQYGAPSTFYGAPAGGGQQTSSPFHSSHPANAPKRKAAFGVGTLVASILAAGLVGGGVVAASDAFLNVGSPAAVTSSQQQPVIVNNKDDVNVITAAALKASPSVVTIKATSGGEGGTGSGIILDTDGHILTNTHVVTLDGKAANPSVEVRTSDGKVMGAKIVGTDPLSDLAVIKVDNASGLVPATLGDSSKLNVGDTAVAIGSPLGLTGTVTDGIVSTLNRTISVASSAAPKDSGDGSQGGGEGGFQFAPPDGGQGQSSASQGSISINVIQTDAAINPGNSGGALVNTKGDVIGVNVAIASAGGDASGTGNIGVGFSVPINLAKRVAQEIIDTGKATHGQFGVSVKAKAASNTASAFSIGAEVATVESGSAAAQAGIRVGDVVTKFNDLAISDPNQLTAAVREQPAGATVKVTILRGGQEQQLDVTLGAAAEQ